MHDRKNASLLVKLALHLPVIREQPCDMGARTERIGFACAQQRVNLSCRTHIAERLTFRYAFDQYFRLWSEIHCRVRPARSVHASLKPAHICQGDPVFALQDPSDPYARRLAILLNTNTSAI